MPSFTLAKLNDGFMIGKPNTYRPSLKMTTLAIADLVKTTGHSIKRDHFDILAKGKTDYQSKIKHTNLFQELELSMSRSKVKGWCFINLLYFFSTVHCRICLKQLFNEPWLETRWSVLQEECCAEFIITTVSFDGMINGGSRELTLKCKLKCWLNPWITHWALALVKEIREPHKAKKKSFDLGGNRTHDLRIRSAVTLPTELPGRTEKVGDDLGGESRRRESKGTY